MPDDSVSTLQEDLTTLIKGQAQPPAEVPPATEPPATEATAEPTPEGEPKPEAEPQGEKWDKGLQKWTQKQTTEQQATKRELNDKIDRLEKRIEKLMEASGIPADEPAPANVTPVAQTNDPRITEQQLELRFLRIKLDHPAAEPEKMFDEALAECFETFGIDENTQALPEGITEKAVETLAKRIFDRKVAALKPAAKVPTTPAKKTTPPPSRPPLTPGGAAVRNRPASHIPAPRTAANIPSFREDLAQLMERNQT